MRRYLVSALIGGMLLTGCAPAMRPGTRTPGGTPSAPTPAPTAPTAPGTTQSGLFTGMNLRTDNMARARRVAQVANGVPGVDVAYALVSGNTAVVGVRTRTGGATTGAGTVGVPGTTYGTTGTTPMGTSGYGTTVPGTTVPGTTVPGTIVPGAIVPGATVIRQASLESAVANAVRSADPSLTQVYVTNDTNIVESMRLIDQNNRAGRTTNVDAQMRDIIARINNRGGR